MDNNIEELSEELFQELKKRVPELKLTAGVVKVLEELGEVADIALRIEGVQRKVKHLPEAELKEKLAKEICDTIIPLIIIAKAEGIDIFPKLEEVMKQEIERWKAEDK